MTNKNNFFTDTNHYTESFEHSEYSEEDIREIEALEAAFPLERIEKMLNDIEEPKAKYVLKITNNTNEFYVQKNSIRVALKDFIKKDKNQNSEEIKSQATSQLGGIRLES